MRIQVEVLQRHNLNTLSISTMMRLLLVAGLVANISAFTTPRAASRHTPDHLRYANLEKSALFTTDHGILRYESQHEQLVVPGAARATPMPTPNRSQDEPALNNRHSASDWLYNLKTIHKSSVFREIRNPVASVAVWGTIISVLQRLLAHSGTATLRLISQNMCVPSSAHSFLVSSLGLLLVFRTNSAYQRFMVRGNYD
jgi:hypothetical protein